MDVGLAQELHVVRDLVEVHVSAGLEIDDRLPTDPPDLVDELPDVGLGDRSAVVAVAAR